MSGLSTVQNTLLAYTAAALSGKQADANGLEHQERIFQECWYQSVALLLFRTIKINLYSKWIQQSNQLLAANLRSELAPSELLAESH